MSEETQKPIEKSWAVYHDLKYVYRIGKIYRKNEDVFWIKFMENEDSEAWDSRYVRAFDDPLKAIAYLLVITVGKHTSHKKLFHRSEREDIIQSLFAQFPSERKNIENLLAAGSAQSRHKRTLSIKDSAPELFGGFGSA